MKKKTIVLYHIRLPEKSRGELGPNPIIEFFKKACGRNLLWVGRGNLYDTIGLVNSSVVFVKIREPPKDLSLKIANKFNLPEDCISVFVET